MKIYLNACINLHYCFRCKNIEVSIELHILRQLFHSKYSGTSTAWNDPHQFAAMAAAAANNMENLEMLSSLLGTHNKLIYFHKLKSL